MTRQGHRYGAAWWTPAWFRRQLRPWRLGFSGGTVARIPVLTTLVAGLVWGVWLMWALLVGFALACWWSIAWLVLAVALCSRGVQEVGYWGAGKVADRA